VKINSFIGGKKIRVNRNNPNDTRLPPKLQETVPLTRRAYLNIQKLDAQKVQTKEH